MTEEYTLREAVFRAFLENPDLGPNEMAIHLNAKYNSVKVSSQSSAGRDCSTGRDAAAMRRTPRGFYSTSWTE